ncbi:MAG: hypothetical protein NC419_09720 [Muribaculaceae bacterium]|nr:hypothetical protein [Muribaculaceae bacterium]
MEEKKTIFSYLGQVFMIFGITIAILNLLCLLFGENAQTVSTMFALGKEGISVATMLQFLLVSVGTVVFRFIFFTDAVIKDMRLTVRTIGMVIAEILMIVVFVLVFDWFPADNWQPWGMFLLCFIVCFGVSVTITDWKERLENKRMEAALARLKEQEMHDTSNKTAHS